MRLAVITDIHGNFRAFQAVLSDIAKQNIARIVSLGDNIGYGPEPDEVVSTLAKHGVASIQGNHELALISPAYYKQLNPPTRQSLDLTRGLLTQTSLDWLAELEPTLQLSPGSAEHRAKRVVSCTAAPLTPQPPIFSTRMTSGCAIFLPAIRKPSALPDTPTPWICTSITPMIRLSTIR